MSVRVVAARILGVTRHHTGITRSRALSALPSGSGSVPPVTRSERNAAASVGAVDDGGSANSATAATERAVGSPERLTFQAETKQLLNIVANSLYTDKHVFIRELVSNASDALEKVRHATVAGDAVRDPETPLAIHITTDEAANTITFTDTGCGMTREELVENLGTIARSGSRAFMARLKEGGGAGDTGANIIGQFGVGFYSAFMVSHALTVYTQSAAPGVGAWRWSSTGDGTYEVTPAEGVARGTKIVVALKDTCREFSVGASVKGVLAQYSNFVHFPVFLNGKQGNTVRALWTLPKADVSDAAYAEFYKYKSGAFDAPLYRLHFSADAPTNIKALLYVGASHDEKYGMGRVKPGTDLYSRKVLIEAASGVLPDWLRFVVGVVDSEDIPLNISRETMQDSALHKRLRAVLTRRFLRFLDAEARRDADTYNTRFFPEFGQFLKEGAVTDPSYAGDIAKLLRFESSLAPAGSLTSLDEYVSRMPPGQGAIYYLVAPHRAIAEASPYMEAFRGAAVGALRKIAPLQQGAGGTDAPAAGGGDVEVLFLYSPIDDFVMNNLREFNGRRLTTAETAELDPGALKGLSPSAPATASSREDAEAAAPAVPTRLSDVAVGELGAWLVASLPKRLSKVRATARLKESPAVVTDHESASLRRMMRMVESGAGKDSEALKLESHVLPKQVLEINPAHPVIVALHAATRVPATAALALAVAEQVVDNALIAAGLVDDPRTMLPRLNALLERLLGVHGEHTYTGAAALEAQRWVPPAEASEREGLAFGEELADEMDKPAYKERQQTSEAAGKVSAKPVL